MAHHEPFKSLGPIDWPDVPTDDLAEFLMTTFSQAQTVVDSVPAPDNAPAGAASEHKTGRARAHTDAGVMSSSAPDLSRQHDPDHAARLRKEWKEVKVNAKETPLGIAVYKLSSKDGRGAWFARRSLHEGVGFDKFKLCLEREFDESMKNTTQATPGKGAIRGIGAERKVEDEVCHGVGRAEVYLLSAQFPGPTTPRDFVTLLLTSDAGAGVEDKDRGRERKKSPGIPRQFMIVSKPCVHPDCEQRQGFIRGVYESVEIIREVPVVKPLRRVRSSIDMGSQDGNLKQDRDAEIAKEAMLRSAMKTASTNIDDKNKKSISFAPSESMPASRTESPAAEGEVEMAIEWLMITRSDPGGSVPRFMIEKGTPGGIVNDAGRFLRWLASKDPRSFDDSGDSEPTEVAINSENGRQLQAGEASDRTSENGRPGRGSDLVLRNASSAPEEPPGGFYGMIAGALGAATSYAAGLVGGAGRTTDSEDTDEKDESDISSERSFASAEEGSPSVANSNDVTGEVASARSFRSEGSPPASITASQHEKELKKLQDRQRKIQDKIAKSQERDKAKSKEDSSAAMAKLREKHEREIAKQEEKYQKELKKIEEKRKQDERKAEERRRKQQEKEEKNNAAMELERVKVERDMALKQLEILRDQVGELQAQNTMLVAKLGKLGGLGKDEEELIASEKGSRNSTSTDTKS